MNFRDLQYFVALVDHAHFAKAADACFVSQPALSMQIKKLEATLGVSLIERQNKTFMLTKVGLSIAAQAREILGKMDALKETATHAKDPYSGELKLGVIPTLGPYLLPHISPGISKAFPKLTTYLIEEQTAKLILKVKQAKLDAALIALPVMDNDLVALPLFEEEFLLAVPANPCR
jgi:LysR family hydrogen peroxide-inducible transcriptional activator